MEIGISVMCTYSWVAVHCVMIVILKKRIRIVKLLNAPEKYGERNQYQHVLSFAHAHTLPEKRPEICTKFVKCTRIGLQQLGFTYVE